VRVTANHQRRVALRSSEIGDGVTLTSPGSAPEQSLTVTALPSSVKGVLVLRVVGEIDLITVGGLREQLHEYLSSDCRGLVLDFTGVSFLAACGIGLLVEIANRAHDTGKVLRLVTGSQLVQRALQVTMAGQAISRANTVAEALAHCAV
jgi:anti-sigma B factor antagonist